MTNYIEPEFVTELPEDIDERNTAASKWAVVAARLREKPGVWAIVATDQYVSVASNITHGKMKAFPKGEYEAKPHGHYNDSTKAGKTTQRARRIYARYIGADGTPAKPVTARPPLTPVPKRAPTPTPIDAVAQAVARFHAVSTGADWALVHALERTRREQVALVAFRAVYDLIKDDMEKHIKARGI